MNEKILYTAIFMYRKDPGHLRSDHPCETYRKITPKFVQLFLPVHLHHSKIQLTITGGGAFEIMLYAKGGFHRKVNRVSP